MKQVKLLLLLLPLLLVVVMASAQKKEITGKVTDQTTGLPLNGVSIVAGKEKVGTTTKEDGTFFISVGPGIKVLTFSSVGYTAQTVTIESKTSINVTLVSDIITQSEVVVIGYGTQKRSNVSGAVSKYKNERIDEAPVSRLDQALQGKIAGVNVQNISSEAGADPKISIRGISSINAGATPLVVVDGQITPDGLSFINPADVESVEVLKDAASAAIYGSRGSSGVILVTTKKGIADKPRYTFKYTIGQKSDYSRYDVMTTSEYVSMLFIEMINKRSDPTVNQATNTVSTGDRASYILENQILGQGTDWQSESLRKALFQNIQLGVSGGTKNFKYYFSGGYQGDKGMMYKSNYEKFNVRAKMDVDLGRKVKLTINVNPSYANRESPSQNFTNFWRMPGWLTVRHTEATAALARTNPLQSNIKAGDYAHQRHFSALTYTGIMPDGTPWTGSGNPGGSAQQNPKSEVDRTDINTNEYRLQSSAELSINLLPGLNFKSLASGYLNYSKGLDFAQRSANRDGDLNVGIFTNNSNIYLLSENTLNYVKTFGNHDITALFGITTERTDINREQTTGLDFPSDDIRTLASAAQVDKARTFGTKAIIGLNSFLGRVTYAFQNKYLFSTSLRRDGSSYFGPGNKWGTFPAVSFGWAAGKEKFLSNVKWLSNLKFRGSYGATGNNRIVADAWVDLLYGANYPFGTATGTGNPGLITSSAIIGNPDITWERTFQTNFGVDISLFKNRVGITLDVYNSKTEKLLLQQSVMAFTGVQQYWNNLGSLRNTGFELEVSSKNIQAKNFRWTTSANLSRNQNEIIELGSEAFLLNQGERSEVYRNQVGKPLVEFLGFKTNGVWMSQAEIDEARAKGLTTTLPAALTPGGLKIVDINGDNILNNDDRVILGNPYPDFIWGITNNFAYKGFELSVFLQGSHGGKIINGDPNYNESGRYMRVYNTNRWVSAGFPGDGKTPASRGTGFNWMLTDYVIEDASYWSLREINLSYALNASIIKRLGLNGLRVYVAAQNLYFHMASNYRSLNPEGRFQNGPYRSVLIDGYQRGTFPIPRTFTFGIDINF
jgi:TonB-dependent starch-binding outer membrane protein SusC